MSPTALGPTCQPAVLQGISIERALQPPPILALAMGGSRFTSWSWSSSSQQKKGGKESSLTPPEQVLGSESEGELEAEAEAEPILMI